MRSLEERRFRGGGLIKCVFTNGIDRHQSSNICNCVVDGRKEGGFIIITIITVASTSTMNDHHHQQCDWHHASRTKGEYAPATQPPTERREGARFSTSYVASRLG